MNIKKHIFKIYLLMLLTFAFSNIEEGDLIITEYFTVSDGQIPNYIEIYNSTNNEIDLGLVSIVINNSNDIFYVNSSETIQSKDYLLLISSEGFFRDELGEIFLPINDPRRDSTNQMYQDGFEDLPILPNSILIGDDDENIFFVDDEANSIRIYYNEILIDKVEWDINLCNQLNDQESCSLYDYCLWIEQDLSCYTNFIIYDDSTVGYANELIFDPEIEDSYIINDFGYNWSISKQKPTFMFNDESQGNQEFGSPGFSNHTPINLKVEPSLGGQNIIGFSWENSHQSNSVFQFKFYINGLDFADQEYNNNNNIYYTQFDSDSILNGNLYYLQIAAVYELGQVSDLTDPFYFYIPKANAGIDDLISYYIYSENELESINLDSIATLDSNLPVINSLVDYNEDDLQYIDFDNLSYHWNVMNIKKSSNESLPYPCEQDESINPTYCDSLNFPINLEKGIYKIKLEIIDNLSNSFSVDSVEISINHLESIINTPLALSSLSGACYDLSLNGLTQPQNAESFIAKHDACYSNSNFLCENLVETIQNEASCDSSNNFWVQDVDYCNENQCIEDGLFWSLDHDGIEGGSGIVNFDGSLSISDYVYDIFFYKWKYLTDDSYEVFNSGVNSENINIPFETGDHSIILEVTNDQNITHEDHAELKIKEFNFKPNALISNNQDLNQEIDSSLSLQIPHDGLPGLQPTFYSECNSINNESDCENFNICSDIDDAETCSSIFINSSQVCEWSLILDTCEGNANVCDWNNDDCETDGILYLPSYILNAQNSYDPNIEDDLYYKWFLNDTLVENTVIYENYLSSIEDINTIRLEVNDPYSYETISQDEQVPYLSSHTINIEILEEQNNIPNLRLNTNYECKEDTICINIPINDYGIPGQSENWNLSYFNNSEDIDNDNFITTWYYDSDDDGILNYGNFFNDYNCNGIYDINQGEPYIDSNENGIFNDGELFFDLDNNSEYNGSELLFNEEDFGPDSQAPIYQSFVGKEPFFDCNTEQVILNDTQYEIGQICENDILWQDEFGNGIWDFDDLNGNQICDNASECEEFIDINKNGIWEKGFYPFFMKTLDSYCNDYNDYEIDQTTKLLVVDVKEDNIAPELINSLNDIIAYENQTITFTASIYDSTNTFSLADGIRNNNELFEDQNSNGIYDLDINELFYDEDINNLKYHWYALKDGEIFEDIDFIIDQTETFIDCNEECTVCEDDTDQWELGMGNGMWNEDCDREIFDDLNGNSRFDNGQTAQLITTNLETNDTLEIDIHVKAYDPFYEIISDQFSLKIINSNEAPLIVNNINLNNLIEDDSTIIIPMVGENYVDENGNGIWDFEDLNTNQICDLEEECEQFEDLNFNNIFDEALFFDPDNDSLSFNIEYSSNIFEAVIDNGLIYINLLPNKFGDGQLTIIADDGFISTSYVVDFYVESVNDPPIITSEPVNQAVEDVLYQYYLNWNDVDDTSFIIEIQDAPMGMTHSDPMLIEENENSYFQSIISWIPLEGVLIADEINLVIYDDASTTGQNDNVLSASQEFTIVVEAVNDPPIVQDIPIIEINENDTIFYQINIDDPDNDSFIFKLGNLPEEGFGEEFTDSNNNGIWDPAEDFIDLNDNSEWDEGEEFTDFNNNGTWDPAEEYIDSNNDRIYNESIKIDSNGTIIWSPGEGIEGLVNFSFSVRDGEFFYDDNNNSQFDDGEIYIDANNNSIFDYGIQSFSNFSIIVNPINDLPIVINKPMNLETNEDDSLLIDINQFEIFDPDNVSNDLYVILQTGTNYYVDDENLSLLFPNQNYFGQLNVLYAISDGIDTTDVDTLYDVNVLSINDPPYFNINSVNLIDNILVLQEDFSDTILIYITPDTIPYGEQEEEVTYSVGVGYDFINYEINTTNQNEIFISLTSLLNSYAYSETFEIIASDNSESNNIFSLSFDITVESINDLPTFNLVSQSFDNETNFIDVNEDFSDSIIIEINDYFDVEDNDKIFSISPNDLEWVDINIDSISGKITLKSISNQFGGEQDFTVSSIEQIDSDIIVDPVDKFFTLLVRPLNDSPEFNYLNSELLFFEDFEFDTAFCSYFDPDNDNITFSLENNEFDWVNLTIDPNTGNLYLESIDDAIGEDTIYIFANDNQDSTNSVIMKEYILKVNDVNDPPIFNLSMNSLNLIEDFVYSDTLFISPILPLPLAEENQIVNYSILPESVDFIDFEFLNGNDGIYLSFSSILNKSGFQDFAIIAQDDGDTLNGGVDTATLPFSLTVQSINEPIELIEELMDKVVDEDFDTIAINLNDIVYDIENEISELILDTVIVDEYVIDQLYDNSIDCEQNNFIWIDSYCSNLEFENQLNCEQNNFIWFDYQCYDPDVELVKVEKNADYLKLISTPNANDAADIIIILSDLGDNADQVYGDTTTSSIDLSFRMTVNQVQDPDSLIGLSITDSINEDTTDYQFVLYYENFDAYPTLNAEPEGSSDIFIEQSIDNPIFSFNKINEFYIDSSNNYLNGQLWEIESLLPNWNGTDTIYISSSTQDSLQWIINVNPINDPPVVSNAYFNPELEKNEDEFPIEFFVEYYDVDADTLLNLYPSDNSLLTWDFINDMNNIFASYYVADTSFWIDSLRSNWNGIDTLEIVLKDDHLAEGRFNLITEVNQVMDFSKLFLPYFENNGNSIIEDTTIVGFTIPYQNVDINPDLNAVENYIDIDSIYIVDNNIFQNIKFIEQSSLNSDVSEKWEIENLLSDWNGIDTLEVFLAKSYNGLTFVDTILFPIQVNQINDMPYDFSIEKDIESFSIDTSSFFSKSDSLFFRYPFTLLPIDTGPANLLLKWNRSYDVDTDSTINNDLLYDLFYRVELVSVDNDSDDLIYVIGDKIRDSQFDLDRDSLCLAIVMQDSICSKYDFFNNYDYAYSSLNLQDSTFAYPMSSSYEELNRNNKYLIDGINGEKKYKWRIIAYNDEFDLYGDDPEKSVDSEDKSFLIDIVLPTADINIIQNEMFSEFFDIYLTTSEEIIDHEGLNQPISVFMEPLTPRILYEPEFLDQNIYTLSSAFIDTGRLSIQFQGRDQVQNYGISSDTLSYQIISSDNFNSFSSISGLVNLSIPPGALDNDRGVIIMEYNVDVIERGSKWPISNEIYISPDNFSLNLPATIEFKIDDSLTLDYFPWQIQIFKREDNSWIPLSTKYENGVAFTQTYELGYFAVFVNLDAVKEEFELIPVEFDLKPAYPNPFNPFTSIQFDMPFESRVNLSVFNIKGEKIKELSDNIYQPGQYNVIWDGSNFPSGMYFIKMQTLGFSKTTKILLLK